VTAFVLVHGAWHGAWCWQRVAQLLEARGHRVDAIDLPGHGEDRTPVAGMTLEAYAERVRRAVEAAGERVVLVGHSMGGMSVTQAAEHVPDRIAALVYVAAFLPRDGQSLPMLAEGDPDALVLPNLVVDEAAGTVVVAPHALRDAFYGECSDEDAGLAIARLVPESLAAMGAPVSLSGRAAGVPRVYVECLRDRAITIHRQREMHGASPCARVVSLDTDHSPFFSAAAELADLLASVVP